MQYYNFNIMTYKDSIIVSIMLNCAVRDDCSFSNTLYNYHTKTKQRISGSDVSVPGINTVSVS